MASVSVFAHAVTNGFAAASLGVSQASDSSSRLLDLPSSVESHSKDSSIPRFSRSTSSFRSIDSYELKQEVGRGAFGVVREARDTTTGHVCCCKSIAKEKLTEEMQKEIRLEADVMMHLKGHPHVVEIQEFFEDDTHIHIVQELCAGGDLYSKVLESPVPMPEAEASVIMMGVLTVLQHCHSSGVIYRDVKPDNFLLSTNDSDAMIKATDFGISRFLKPDEVLETYCGTPLYMAPEVFDMKYAFPADIWAAGVMLYWLMCRDFPFTGKNTFELARSVCSRTPTMSGMLWDNVSADAKDLITLMLQKDPSKRPTAEDLLDHKWFKPAAPEPPPPLLKKKSSFSLVAKSVIKAMREQASGSYGKWELHSPLAHHGNSLNIRKLERERNWGEARFYGNQVHWRDAKVWAELMFKTKWSPSPFNPALSEGTSPESTCLRTQGSGDSRRSRGSGVLPPLPGGGGGTPGTSGRVSQHYSRTPSSRSQGLTPCATPELRVTAGPGGGGPLSTSGGGGSTGASSAALRKAASSADLVKALNKSTAGGGGLAVGPGSGLGGAGGGSGRSFFKHLSSKLDRLMSGRKSPMPDEQQRRSMSGR